MTFMSKVAILATITLAGVNGLSNYGEFGPLDPPFQRSHLKAGKHKIEKADPLNENNIPEHEIEIQSNCNLLNLETKVGNELINEIQNQGIKCVNKMFGKKHFDYNSLKMVAKKTTSESLNYNGKGSKELEALFGYLRTALNSHHHKLVNLDGEFHELVKQAIDAFVNNEHFYDDNNAHGKVLGEVILTIDSSNNHHEYIHVLKNWLNKWNPSYNSKWEMRNAVNHVFRVMYRGPLNEKYVELIKNDEEIVESLKNFVMKKWMLAPETKYMMTNAARELGRLSMYKNAKIESKVNAALGKVFNTYEKVGYGDAVWIGAANTVDRYGDCKTHGICQFKAHVMAGVLKYTKVCSSTIKILYQGLTSAQANAACQILGDEETYFHNKLQTGRVPIPGDQNNQLHVNVFHSYTDYQTYAPGLFNNVNTNNGGIYLEGSPNSPGNVPNFLCHEASYAPNTAKIWNLRHEYVHYLDGRFDLDGGFGASGSYEVVWWAEGLAEYMAYRDDNSKAKTMAMQRTYTLSQLLDNSYASSTQDQIYYWGYLAVRFVIERHFSEVKQMIQYTRKGQWSSYGSVVNTFRNYDSEFSSWLTGDLQTNTHSGGGSTPNTPRTPTPYNPRTPTPYSPPNSNGCSTNCYGSTCVAYIGKGYTCAYLNKYCDCSGCSECSGGSTPTTPTPVGGGSSCTNQHGCNSMTCDYYVTKYPNLYTCATLSSSYQCDCSGCRC